MWLVFIFLFLIIFIRFGVYFSKTIITLNKIVITSKVFKINYRISVYIWGKIRILNPIGNEKGIKIGFLFISYEKIIKRINVEELTKKTFKSIKIYNVKYLKLVIEKIIGECKIGSEDIFITISSITVFSIFLGNFIGKQENTSKRSKVLKRCKYKIIPEFGKNVIEFIGDLSLSFKTRRLGIFLRTKEHTKFKMLVGG